MKETKKFINKQQLKRKAILLIVLIVLSLLAVFLMYVMPKNFVLGLNNSIYETVCNSNTKNLNNNIRANFQEDFADNSKLVNAGNTSSAVLSSVDTQEKATYTTYEDNQKAIVCVKGGWDALDNVKQETQANFQIIENLLDVSTEENVQRDIASKKDLSTLEEKEEINKDASSNNTQILLVMCPDVNVLKAQLQTNTDVLWIQNDVVFSEDKSQKNSNSLAGKSLLNGTAATSGNNLQNNTSTDTQEDLKNKELEFQKIQDSVYNTDNNKEDSASNNNQRYPQQKFRLPGNKEIKQYSTYYNDPLYKYQWGFNKLNNGYTYDIEAENAWKAGADSLSPNVEQPIVAVADSGVDYTHEDLCDSMYGKCDQIEELVSMGGGKYGINLSGDGDITDPIDNEDGHGTHCASAIASGNNNAKGVCGVNGKQAKIIGCKWLGPHGGAVSNCIRVYKYLIAAKKNNVNITCISNSWGVTDANDNNTFAMEAAIIEAGKCGMASCFAAGNDRLNVDNYPNAVYGKNPYTIRVGASNDSGAASKFSNFGQNFVDVFAPGTNMLAAVSTFKDAELKQYLPWIDGKSSSYFYEDFEQKDARKVNFSLSELSTIDKDRTNSKYWKDTTNYDEGEARVYFDQHKNGENLIISVCPLINFL